MRFIFIARVVRPLSTIDKFTTGPLINPSARIELKTCFLLYYYYFWGQLHWNISSLGLKFQVSIVKFKARVRFVYQVFIFSPNDSPLKKLWEMFFVSSKKLFSFSRYSIFCGFFPSFSHFLDPKGQMEVENLWCHELTCINLQM